MKRTAALVAIALSAVAFPASTAAADPVSSLPGLTELGSGVGGGSDQVSQALGRVGIDKVAALPSLGGLPLG